MVGWGHAEPWAHMDEKQGWWGGGGQGEKNQDLGEMLGKELCRVPPPTERQPAPALHVQATPS